MIEASDAAAALVGMGEVLLLSLALQRSSDRIAGIGALEANYDIFFRNT